MRLVVDANILISALIRNGKSREIIVSDIFELFCPEYLGEEIYRHREYIAEKSGLSADEIALLSTLLLRRVHTIPSSVYERKLNEARSLIRIDPEDAPYVACFLAIKCDGIWTNDTDFEGKGKLVVFKTADLLKLMKG